MPRADILVCRVARADHFNKILHRQRVDPSPFLPIKMFLLKCVARAARYNKTAARSINI